MKKAVSCLTVMLCCMNVSLAHNEGYATQKSDDKNFPVDLCYVLCDFSASQGKSLQTIREKALKIYNAAKLKCRLRFYDINAPQFAEPFFQFDLLAANAKRPSDKIKFQKIADSMSKVLDASLVKKSMPSASQSTCIIRTLITSVQSLSDVAKSKEQRIWIVALSDVLEDCIYDFGHVDIDNASFENALKLLDKMPKPLFTLKDYKNINVKLTVCSEDNKLNSEKLFLFWKKVLSKFDYNLVLPITRELPYWVNNNN
jgi:hypothetical protein